MTLKPLTIVASLLLASCCVSAVLMPRSKAPDFQNLNAVVNQSFTKMSLSDFKDKFLILLFYPFGLCN
jgi:peroxiredoxin